MSFGSPGGFICCPDCSDPFCVKRIGPVGQVGIPDSVLFKCICCGTTFRRKGAMTILEAMGSIE